VIHATIQPSIKKTSENTLNVSMKNSNNINAKFAKKALEGKNRSSNMLKECTRRRKTLIAKNATFPLLLGET
jgi:hypothetical protein